MVVSVLEQAALCQQDPIQLEQKFVSILFSLVK